MRYVADVISIARVRVIREEGDPKEPNVNFDQAIKEARVPFNTDEQIVVDHFKGDCMPGTQVSWAGTFYIVPEILEEEGFRSLLEEEVPKEVLSRLYGSGPVSAERVSAEMQGAEPT